jgi:hypothetical protein
MRGSARLSRRIVSTKRKSPEPRIWFDRSDIEQNFQHMPNLDGRRPKAWQLVDGFMAVKSEGALDADTINGIKGWLAHHLADHSGFAVLTEAADVLIIGRFLMSNTHPSRKLVRPLF